MAIILPYSYPRLIHRYHLPSLFWGINLGMSISVPTANPNCNFCINEAESEAYIVVQCKWSLLDRNELQWIDKGLQKNAARCNQQYYEVSADGCQLAHLNCSNAILWIRIFDLQNRLLDCEYRSEFGWYLEPDACILSNPNLRIWQFRSPALDNLYYLRDGIPLSTIEPLHIPELVCVPGNDAIDWASLSTDGKYLACLCKNASNRKSHSETLVDAEVIILEFDFPRSYVEVHSRISIRIHSDDSVNLKFCPKLSLFAILSYRSSGHHMISSSEKLYLHEIESASLYLHDLQTLKTDLIWTADPEFCNRWAIDQSETSNPL